MTPAADGYFHPASESELQALVRHAAATGRRVRVRGAAHSVHAAIFAQAEPSAEVLELMLDRYCALRFDDALRQVTAQAGVHLGVDPRDPTGRSSLDDALCPALAARGWALPDLGGISHQTLAGFLATGSAGGSVHHAFTDAVVAMRIVDGTGAVRTFRRHVPHAPTGRRWLQPQKFSSSGGDLAGALVSLGLLGVVSEVTLQCEPNWDLIGDEAVSSLTDAEVDLFSDGDDGLCALFERSEYLRLLWWPQPGVDRLVVWKARRMQPSEYDGVTGPPQALRRLPYLPFPEVMGSTLPMQASAGLALRAIGNRPAQVAGLGGPVGALLRKFTEAALAPVYRGFVPVDAGGRQHFHDSWWQGLPMDDSMEERFMKVSFLEAWLPLSSAGEAMRRLRAHVAEGGYAASGNFVIELYPGAASEAWLSPGHGTTPKLRINVFSLQPTAPADERRFFDGILTALEGLEVRLHWGKHLFADPAQTAAVTRTLPRFADFLSLRAECDPAGVFLTDYWRAHLGLSHAPARVESFTREPRGTARLPLVFRLLPVPADFAQHAAHRFENRAHLNTTPERAFEVFAHDLDATKWMADLHSVGLPSGRLDGVGEIVDVNFHYMTVRSRYEKYEPGKLLRGVVDAWSLPLCERMMFEAYFEPAPGGGTEFAWKIWFDAVPAFRKLVPIVRPFFARIFRRTTEGLAAYFELNAVGSQPAPVDAGDQLRRAL